MWFDIYISSESKQIHACKINNFEDLLNSTDYSLNLALFKMKTIWGELHLLNTSSSDTYALGILNIDNVLNTTANSLLGYGQ